MSEAVELLARIDKLESQNRRTRWIAAVGVFLILLAETGTLVMRQRISKQLEVNELIVKDRSGKIVARLGGGNREACLELMGTQGITKAALCVDNHYGSSLYLSNQQPKASVFLSAGNESYGGPANLLPGLAIDQEDGKNSVSITVSEKSEVLIGHGTSENSLMLSSANNKPTIRVLGSEGKVVWTAP